MSMTELLHLPTLSSNGAMNMALDEVLLDAAINANQPMLRFYGWATPTVTLGYFQPVADRLARTGIAELAWVRRPTGGATLVHDSRNEFTYALALPEKFATAPDAANWICLMHYLIRDALASLGVQARAVVCGEEARLGPVLCFRHQTPADLLCAGAKVVGSAQRKLRGALLQHGGILLKRSAFTPSLPGLYELTGRDIAPAELAARLAAKFAATPGDWTPAELAARATLAAEKYGHPAWNEKR